MFNFVIRSKLIVYWFCRPFYGYHKDEKSFLKIEFYNPAIVRRAADLLLVKFKAG